MKRKTRSKGRFSLADSTDPSQLMSYEPTSNNTARYQTRLSTESTTLTYHVAVVSCSLKVKNLLPRPWYQTTTSSVEGKLMFSNACFVRKSRKIQCRRKNSRTRQRLVLSLSKASKMLYQVINWSLKGRTTMLPASRASLTTTIKHQSVKTKSKPNQQLNQLVIFLNKVKYVNQNQGS